MEIIDILLSTYNGERYLKEQLDSILAQTYTNWHLFVRDDGSSDGTLDILNDYVMHYPDKIDVYISNENLGCMRSFEVLMQKSNAHYICFADQDDVWLPQKIEHSINFMFQNEKEGKPLVVYGDLKVVDADLNLLHQSFLQFSGLSFDRSKDSTSQLAVASGILGCTMLINQKAKEVSLPLGKYAYMHDYWIVLKTLASGGNIFMVPYIDILYRQHRDNVCGAVKAEKGLMSVISYKLKNANKITCLNRDYFLQANEAFGMSVLSYLWFKLRNFLRF